MRSPIPVRANTLRIYACTGSSYERRLACAAHIVLWRVWRSPRSFSLMISAVSFRTSSICSSKSLTPHVWVNMCGPHHMAIYLLLPSQNIRKALREHLFTFIIPRYIINKYIKIQIYIIYVLIMYIYIYIYKYTYTYLYIYIYIYKYKCVYIYIYMNGCMNMHLYKSHK